MNSEFPKVKDDPLLLSTAINTKLHIYEQYHERDAKILYLLRGNEHYSQGENLNRTRGRNRKTRTCDK